MHIGWFEDIWRGIRDMANQSDVLKPLTWFSIGASLIAYGCGWVYPEWKPLFQGVAIGILASWLAQLHLAFRVHQLGGAVIKNVFTHGTRFEKARARSLGFLTRASIMLLAAATAIRFPEHFEVLGTVVGFILVPLCMLGIALWRRKSLV